MALENYRLYQLGMWLVTRLPNALVNSVADLLAELSFLLNRRSRRGLYANLRHVLPAETSRLRRWQIARQAFRTFAYSVVDFFRVSQMNPDNLERFVGECRGWEHLQAAMDAGVGGIVITAHISSWEVGGAYLGLAGVPLTVVALSHHDPRIDELFLGSRRATGMEVVPVGGAMNKLAAALKRGRFVVLLADRDVTGRGPVLPFFGELTRVPNGHAFLALRTGAWILPGCVYRRPDGKLAIEFRSPISPDPACDTIESLTQRCLVVLEDLIRAHPEQWSSFYDLWSKKELPVM
jgi:KDO2-lipid IV(A) lauroyltransferase